MRIIARPRGEAAPDARDHLRVLGERSLVRLPPREPFLDRRRLGDEDTASDNAFIAAVPAPWPVFGDIAFAASPTTATRPFDHRWSIDALEAVPARLITDAPDGVFEMRERADPRVVLTGTAEPSRSATGSMNARYTSSWLHAE